MLGVLCLSILWAICSGQQYGDPSFRSGVMYDEKPILRMGPLSSGEITTTEEPKEPEWVSVLRDNINAVVQIKGYKNAKKDIKAFIDDANEKLNKKSEYQIPGLYDMLKNGEEAPRVRSFNLQPRWEKDLQSYIKGLIGMYGKAHLDDYVRPVIGAIESSNNVNIKDIDVNPYGEVSVHWEAVKKNTKKRNSHLRNRYDNPDMHQLGPDPDDM